MGSRANSAPLAYYQGGLCTVGQPMDSWIFFLALGLVVCFVGGIGYFLFTLARNGQRLF